MSNRVEITTEIELSPRELAEALEEGVEIIEHATVSRLIMKGSHVTGVDLTPEYVAVGQTLCEWVGLGDRVALQEGNATALPVDDASFDRAYMLHVGMNIADKTALAAELFRVLRPGGRLGIYDVMRTGPGDLQFPVPWSMTAEGSAVATPEEYKDALRAAGFALRAERDRRDFALEFFDRLRQASASASGAPPLGLHLLMGETTPVKLQNMVANINESRISPVELIAEKPAQ